MRTTLAIVAILLGAGCSSIASNGLSNGGRPKGTTGGTTTGGASPGSPCTSNEVCASGVCDLAGAGNCCRSACSTSDPLCAASGCDDGGACIYPEEGTNCGTPSCSGERPSLSQPQCNGLGSCSAAGVSACPYNLLCNDAGSACIAHCTSSADCVDGGFSCNNGLCVVPEPVGACTENDDCTSGICGTNGSGHCCTSPCGQGTCGATDCDAFSGDCLYADNSTVCAAASCDAGVLVDAALCNGHGGCGTPQVTSCAPYACGASGCLKTCSVDPDCAGGYCDTANSSCCSLPSGAQMQVDGTFGKDAQACCGHDSAPCQTLGHALHLIDEAQARDVVIMATNGESGGIWAPVGETYPIVLGWGAELVANGLIFTAGDAGNRALFEIGQVSPNDHVGYASIVGPQLDFPTSSDELTILIDPKSTLYLSGAVVYSSLANQTTAIEVSAGAGLVLGQDISGTREATVYIGPQTYVAGQPLGYNGIVCDSANGLGCTITDAPVAGPSVTITEQANHDIDAEDFATISLVAQPRIGRSPQTLGPGKCQSLDDGSSSINGAILLHGKASVTIGNGAIQCIGGTAVQLEASANGLPSLGLDAMFVEDNTIGLHALAGTAAVSRTVIEYNAIGIEQDTDGTNIASIDLSGGAIGGANAVACNTSGAGDAGMPGASVINLTTKPLDASNTNWDTSGPDLFSCNATLTSCSCQSTSCVIKPGADGMDVVTESTGVVVTKGNGVAPVCAQ